MSAPIPLPAHLLGRVVAFPPLAAGLDWAALQAACPPGFVLVCVRGWGGDVVSVPDEKTYNTLHGACVVYAVPAWVTNEEQPR